MQLQAGRVVGWGWKIESVLGRGGTSTVYRATRVDGTRGAVKVFHRNLSQNPKVLKLLLAEARLVAKVDHPGTVQLLDEGETDDGSIFLIFELLTGRTLDELRHARGGRVPLEEIMPLGNAVMDALSAVHAAGIVHRDLKPPNIFVLDGGGVKLLDFGFAKQHGYTSDAAQNVVGTPSFMAPEAALGLTKKMDARTDVWSLGATLFQALSGQSVHLGKHMDAMMLATASTRARSLAEAAPELPSKIVAVVDRALAFRKADRWQDIPSMQQAWKDAHPHWLPPMPPPTFTATEPEFLDADLLVPADDSAPLFDPRELVESVQPQPKPPPPRRR
jgi:serine/threonine-protein kinase